MGIAVTDPMQIVANPLTTVHSKDVIQFLKDYIAKEEVEVFVVGKPSRLDGSDTDATKHVEIFVNSLVKNFPQIPVERVDERFTSLIAKRSLVEIGMKKKDRQNKENLDQVSAALILQSYMEMKNR